VLVIAGLVFDILEPAMWVLVVVTTWTAARRIFAVRTAARA